jgi:EAL domain-containing protein (putative c-di-GMP-specific phosphodiesterase class I)/PAS domain-containing protein
VRSALALFRLRPVRIVLNVVLTGMIAALLAATIFWTHYNVMWIAFLGGILFAAALAMMTQISRAQWLAARRTAQLDRLRNQLNQETARNRTSAEAARIADIRLRLLSDAVPSLIFYVDRDERCRFHNQAAERKTGRSSAQIDGHVLREVLGSACYSAVAPHIPDTLAGKIAQYEFAWTGTAVPETFTARHVPYPPDGSPCRGFYLLLSSVASRAAVEARPSRRQTEESPDSGVEGFAVAGEGGETLYLRSITDELMGWDDPRSKLEHALKGNQFLLFAQKILPIKTGAPDPDCYEVLLRLREEEDNLLPPGGFIPIAERFGMLEELDRWVVRSVLSWCADRQTAAPRRRIPLCCVNLFDATVTNVEFARFVLAELARTRVDGRSLCFEISEQDILNHHATVQRFANALRPAGCRFTVDGFGSVKVSFTHLKGLPLDFIKIDGIIIQNILRQPTDLAKARAINTVCSKIGLRTIAEFVETTETLAKLREIGVDYVQGFGVARPQPISKIP